MNNEATRNRVVNSFLRCVKPSYDEVALLLMSATALALFSVDSQLRSQIAGLFTAPGEPGPVYFLIWAGVIVGGLALAIVHAFSSRPKTAVAKAWMGAFAMATNGIAGIACGMEMLESEWCWQGVFPIWNIVSGVALLYLMALAPEDTVTDEDATLGEILLGLVVVAAVFWHCQYSAHFTWAMTFSVCVAYSTTLAHPVGKIFRSGTQRKRPNGTTKAWC